MRHKIGLLKAYPRGTPGSKEAVARGCTCPVMDNSHGAGAYGGGFGADGLPVFWRTPGCPVHPDPKNLSRA